ncbi:alpha/beta hydrolase [Saccharopolyspora sp. MS10]|uniref:alpha/beta hydrolase n=1 Tax=Saccharopolyspora sp. MS10 TaxID=3385973 RepID=UPI0039A0E741
MIEASQRTVEGPRGERAAREWAGRDPGWIALLLHGYGEHAGRYQWLAEQLVAARALVIAPDLEGHGDSPGERVLIDDAEHVVGDVEAVLRDVTARHPELPVVLIGHSLGGLFATRFAQENPDCLAAVVLSSPVLGTWHVLDLLECDELPQTPIDPSTLSRDPEVGRAYEADPLVWHGSFKRPTLRMIDRALEAVNDGPVLRVPTLWVHGEDDELVPEADTRTGIDRIRGQDFHEHVYPGARHELFNETNRAEVVDEVLTFIGRQLNT